jgi:hypothetical protein
MLRVKGSVLLLSVAGAFHFIVSAHSRMSYSNIILWPVFSIQALSWFSVAGSLKSTLMVLAIMSTPTS